MKRITSLTTNLRKDARHQVSNELFPCPKNWIHRLGISVEVECKVRRFIKLNNMEIQFWGYESGNILATIAGAGGFTLFGNTIRDVLHDSSLNGWSKVFYLASEHPDATVTLGLLVLLLCAPLVRNPIEKLGSIDLMNVIDTLLFTLAIFILLYAMNSDTSWLSVSGASFVVASSFLRYSEKKSTIAQNWRPCSLFRRYLPRYVRIDLIGSISGDEQHSGNNNGISNHRHRFVRDSRELTDLRRCGRSCPCLPMPDRILLDETGSYGGMILVK